LYRDEELITLMEVESLPNLGRKDQPTAVSKLNRERVAVGHTANIPRVS